MASDLLLTRLRQLHTQLLKESEQQRAKGDRAMMGGPDKPIMEWTPAQRATFCRTSTETRLARSGKDLHRAIDLQFAAEELLNIVFLEEVRRGLR